MVSFRVVHLGLVLDGLDVAWSLLGLGLSLSLHEQWYRGGQMRLDGFSLVMDGGEM